VKHFALLLTLFALVPITLLSCGGENDENDATGSATDAATEGGARRTEESPRRREPAKRSGPSKPSISIRTPKNGQTVHGDGVTVSVSVTGFRVVDQRVRPPFPPPVAGKGHVHFYLDTEMLPTTHSPPATGTYRSLSTTSYTWAGVAPGRHSFAVQLVGKDHAPLSTPVKDRITATVR
jgi:hypothetical protein